MAHTSQGASERPATSNKLSESPSGRTDRSSIVQGQKSPKVQSGEAPWPKISVVTPSYNQGEFIEETIRSVLLQDYPNLEYILIDGGSMDVTVDVLERYDDCIDYWESTSDRGQAHAINKGFRRATGDVLCWLNSDDLFMPNALHRVGRYFRNRPSAHMITGGWITYDDERDHVNACRPCGTGLPPTPVRMLATNAYLGQHSTFWRSEVMDEVGMLNEDLQFAMDHEFFTRCIMSGIQIRAVHEILAVFRQHGKQKTADRRCYNQESQRAKRAYHSNTIIESLRIWFFKRLRDLLQHRGTHPRLGLYFDKDEDVAQAWIEQLKTAG